MIDHVTCDVTDDNRSQSIDVEDEVIDIGIVDIYLVVTKSTVNDRTDYTMSSELTSETTIRLSSGTTVRPSHNTTQNTHTHRIPTTTHYVLITDVICTDPTTRFWGLSIPS